MDKAVVRKAAEPHHFLLIQRDHWWSGVSKPVLFVLMAYSSTSPVSLFSWTYFLLSQFHSGFSSSFPFGCSNAFLWMGDILKSFHFSLWERIWKLDLFQFLFNRIPLSLIDFPEKIIIMLIIVIEMYWVCSTYKALC